MNKIDFSIQLRKRFSPAEWPWLLLALRQDELVWQALEGGALGVKALESLPLQAEAWSPAALSLLALENPTTLEALHNTPLQPLEESLLSRSSKVYEDWIRKPEPPSGLEGAGLLALTFREQFRVSGSWKETLRSLGMQPLASRTPLTCLYGMLPQPAGLMRDLLKASDFEQVLLALHILLANPKPPEVQLAVLKDLAIDLEPAAALIMLQSLSSFRPNMASLLARQILKDTPLSWTSSVEKSLNSDGMEELEKLTRAVRAAQVHQIAGQSDMAVPALAESLRMVRKMRGHLSAQLAHSVAQTKDVTADGWVNTAREASIEAWKQAVQLSPDEPRYAAGYAKALFKAGRATDAAAYVKNYLETQGNAASAELLLTYALVADPVEEQNNAHEAASKALALVLEGQKLSEREAITLSGFLLKENDLPKALQAAQAGLVIYPASRVLLAMLTKIHFNLGEPEAAVEAAYAAQAVSSCDFGEDACLAQDAIPVEDVNRPTWLDEPDDKTIQLMLVESLEALSSWEAAYQERIALYKDQEQLSTQDLRALAICAAGAQKYEKVVEVCRKLLVVDPYDLEIHRQLAESAEALEDYETAIEHFNRAVQLAPEQGALWKGLVRAQEEAGQESASFDTLRAAGQALPADAEIQLQLGELYLTQGAPTLALPCLRRAYTAASPGSTHIVTSLRLGETLFQLGRLDEANQVVEAVYQRARESTTASSQELAIDQGSTGIQGELAHLYARILLGLGEPEKAVPILTQIVRDRPDEPKACLDLAKSLMLLSDKASGARRAIPFLQRLLGLVLDGSPGGYPGGLEDTPQLRAEARALLAEAYASACEWDKALEAFRSALEEPENRTLEMQTRLSTGLGLTALKLELPEMAVAALQEAAQTEPLNAQIQRSLCEAYVSNGLSKDAFQVAKAVVDLAPGDIDTLSWFIEQGLRIAALPGAAQTTISEDVIQALRAALAQAPERADLLIRLGGLLIQAGRRSEALEIFRKLASLNTALQKISIGELYQAGLSVLEAGDARLAVSLLRKAIDQIEGNKTGDEPLKDGISLVDLYEVLVKAFEQLGDLDGALEAIDHALNLDKARVRLYATQVDILYKLGRLESAHASLEAALQRWPDDPGLHYRMGQVLRAMGDLPGALQQAEAGIASMEDAKDPAYRRELYYFAAKLADATLRPRRAFAYLKKAIPETDSEYNLYDNAILRAELALEAGEDQAAAQAVSIFEEQAAKSARALAACGRLDCRRGKRAEADRKCRAAVRMWTKLQLGQPGQTPAASKEEFMAELSALGMAALDNRQWTEALAIFHQMVEMFPDEPQAHYKLAQAMMICAEGQAQCQDFEVVTNAPGEDCLGAQALASFEESLKSAATKAGSAEILKPDGILEDWDVEIKRSIGLCARRGRAAFQPVLENAAALEYILQTIMPDTEDVAALVMAYRRCGAKDRAVKSVEVGWRPAFDNKDTRKDPRVVVQLALAEADLQQAIAIVSEVMADPAIQGVIWPEPPMFQFLLAKLSFQSKDLPNAQEALKKALMEWPDEPRWQAFAAKIHLAQTSDNRLQQLAGAVSYLERASDLEPANGAHQLALGQIYLESGQVQKAIQFLEQAAQSSSANPDCWLALAKAQHLAGDVDQAALSADKAIELSENSPEALLVRGEIALQTDNYRGALSRAQIVLRSQPDDPKALYLLSKALEGLDQTTEALAALEKALPVFDSPLTMQLERLKLIKRAEGLEGGLKVLQTLVAQNPTQAAYLALLADWLMEAGKQDAAVQAARLALQEGLEGLNLKQKADLHTMIGLHMRKIGQLDQSIHHLSEAIALSSDYLDAYLELGKVYQDRREYQQALKIYQKAINLAGGDYRPYYQAGLVLKDNKDYMASEAMLRRAAQLAPNEVAVHRLLGAVVALNLVHSHRLVPGKTSGD